jgi:hypothetical protein
MGSEKSEGSTHLPLLRRRRLLRGHLPLDLLLQARVAFSL